MVVCFKVPNLIPVSLLTAVAIVSVKLILYVYTHCKKPTKAIHEVMFFTDKGASCRNHTRDSSCNSDDCVFIRIRRIVTYIESAQKSLDVCIFLITCYDIARAILKVHEQGRKVRIIVDADRADGSGSQIDIFRKSGIPIQMKKSPFMMHNKFFIVDQNILMTGSFNWTVQAIMGNWENVIITSQPNLVQRYDAHFSQLWNEFSSV